MRLTQLQAIPNKHLSPGKTRDAVCVDLFELDSALSLNLSFFRGYIMSNLYSVFTPIDRSGKEDSLNRRVNSDISSFSLSNSDTDIRLAMPVASKEFLYPQLTEIIIGDGVNDDFKMHRVLVTYFDKYRVNLCKLDSGAPVAKIFTDFKSQYGLDILEWARINSILK